MLVTKCLFYSTQIVKSQSILKGGTLILGMGVDAGLESGQSNRERNSEKRISNVEGKTNITGLSNED
jgi:hypothetical protein